MTVAVSELLFLDVLFYERWCVRELILKRSVYIPTRIAPCMHVYGNRENKLTMLNTKHKTVIQTCNQNWERSLGNSYLKVKGNLCKLSSKANYSRTSTILFAPFRSCFSCETLHPICYELLYLLIFAAWTFISEYDL